MNALSSRKLALPAAIGLALGLNLAATTLAGAANSPGNATSPASPATPAKWLSGDFHQHTYYTDGSTTFDFVMEKSNEFGLDWWANSEHGGERNRDGAGIYTAKVGGLWDALLGEGRRWFNYASSDYHRHYTAGGDDFYPGEYQRTWVKAVDADGDGDYSLNEIADGMRSGNAYFVHGDLVDFLEFSAQSRDQKVEMGGELVADKPIQNLKLKIRFRSPASNNCAVDGQHITSCAAPVVDHIDLIAGEIGEPIDPDSSDYTKATNESAKVVASFGRGQWEIDDEGYNVIVHHI